MNFAVGPFASLLDRARDVIQHANRARLRSADFP